MNGMIEGKVVMNMNMILEVFKVLRYYIGDCILETVPPYEVKETLSSFLSSFSPQIPPNPPMTLSSTTPSCHHAHHGLSSLLRLHLPPAKPSSHLTLTLLSSRERAGVDAHHAHLLSLSTKYRFSATALQVS